MLKSPLLKAVIILFFGLSNTVFAQSKDEYVPCQEMPAIMQDYNADYWAITKFYTPWTGTGFRDNTGSDASIGSPEKRDRLVRLNQEYLKKLEAISFNNLPQECKADYILFRRDLNDHIRQLTEEAYEYSRIKSWIPFADKIYEAEKNRRRGWQPDAERMAKDWSDINKEIKSLQDRLKTDKNLNPESLYTATESIKNLKNALTSVHQFYNGYDPMYTWWVTKPYQSLIDALNKYSDAFRNKRDSTPVDKSGIVGKPAGREELVRQLNYEMIPYTPEELIEIANKELAWCDAEMLKASNEMGFGNNWKAALEKVKNSFVPAGKQPEAILKLYNESVDFIRNKDLITIPPLAEETWGMNMMPPDRQLINPFFTGGTDITISYPTNTMDEDDRMMSMRGNNPHFSRATVQHELIPGHNLEWFMNARYRTYRNFDTPFWIEGWSLYWELLLWDLHFPQSPEDKVGMLFWHMHRCARIIFSLNYHMGKWTPQQCVDFLVDRVGHERANAEGEVRRSFADHYPPLYQLAYLTGGRQFYALKKELVDSGKMTYKQYHDAVMHLNCMPIEMIRAILTNQPLTEEYKTKWRFYGEQK